MSRVCITNTKQQQLLWQVRQRLVNQNLNQFLIRERNSRFIELLLLDIWDAWGV